jgi:hypothetical protein
LLILTVAGGSSSLTLPAPRLVCRTHDSITVRPVVPRGYVDKYRVRSVIVFGKAASSGVDVSVNNTEFKGTGTEVRPARALPGGGLVFPDVTVSGLAINTSYVFAIIGVDEKGK